MSATAQEVEVTPTAVLTARMTRAQRAEVGRQAREALPFEAHAEVPVAGARVDPVALLCRQDEHRLQDLVPIRHGRMSATPFTFYRGAAAIMAADLASMPSTSLGVQICGDAHLSNFGVFNGPDRRLLFDLNDFDETLPGPFEWDVKRLAASVVLAGRDNDVDPAKVEVAVLAAVAGYRTTMAQAAALDPLALHVVRLEYESFVGRLGGKAKDRSIKAGRKARAKNSLRAFDKLTSVQDGRRRIVEDPPLITRHEMDQATIRGTAGSFIDQYRRSLPPSRRLLLSRFQVSDAAFKVVGVGSVGTRCLIALFVSGDEDPLILQIKEASRSVLEDHLGSSEYATAGERVVNGQRLMQAAGDPFLGWAQADVDGVRLDFYVRQLWDGKGTARVEEMGAGRLRLYSEVCGGTLALAHARSGDAATICGYLGDSDDFDRAVARFAFAYADLAVSDHAAHLAAIERGDIPVVRDI